MCVNTVAITCSSDHGYHEIGEILMSHVDYWTYLPSNIQEAKADHCNHNNGVSTSDFLLKERHRIVWSVSFSRGM